MVERFAYTTGTISVVSGESIVTGTGAAWAGRDRAGSQIWAVPDSGAPVRVGTVAEVDPRGVYENLELPLVSPYNGTTLEDVAYELVDGPAIANGATQAAIYARFNAFLEQNMGLVGNTADQIDYALVPNNTLFIDAVTSTIYQWRDGVLEAVFAAAGLSIPNGRLTLVSEEPVMTSDQVAKSTIYYTQYPGLPGVSGDGLRLPLYDGAATRMADVGGQKSISLDPDSGHTSYHQSGKLFDVFWDDVGERLVTGPAWTNETTRAAALGFKNGLLTNAGSMTARFGTSSGDTVSIAANRALYLGTVYCTADGETAMQFKVLGANQTAVLGLFNAYNQIDVSAMVAETTSYWQLYNPDSTLTWRPANGSGNQIIVVNGSPGAIRAEYQSISYPGDRHEYYTGGQTGIGLNWTSGNPDTIAAYYLEDNTDELVEGYYVATLAASSSVKDQFNVAEGVNSITALECAYFSSDIFFYGAGWIYGGVYNIPGSWLSVSLRM